jgi:beta-phosphoglucomutase family hydrolase
MSGDNTRSRRYDKSTVLRYIFLSMIQIPEHVKGLIFDCDGTIADTMPLHYLSWVTALGEHGVEFPEALFYEMAGIPTHRIIEILNDRHHHSMPVDETARRKDALFETRIAEVTAIRPVVEIVQAYFGKLPMAVATGGSRGVVTKTLQALDLSRYFQALVTADDVKHGKPAPDIFLEAARRIGIAPHLCCGFEDADLGLQAIRAAGMLAIDIRPVYIRNRQDVVGKDFPQK